MEFSQEFVDSGADAETEKPGEVVADEKQLSLGAARQVVDAYRAFAGPGTGAPATSELAAWAAHLDNRLGRAAAPGA